MDMFEIFQKHKNTSQARENIRQHIEIILNSRQGSLVHMPEFGLPCLLTIYQGLPGSKGFLMETVKKNLVRYERRAEDISVYDSEEKTSNAVLTLVIIFNVTDVGKHSFSAVFFGDGSVRIHENLF